MSGLLKLFALTLLLSHGSLSHAEPPILLTWFRFNDSDVLRINGIDFPPRTDDSHQTIVARAEAILIPAKATASTPVQVTIPPDAPSITFQRLQGLLPKLDGYPILIFEALTHPTRKVEYIYKGRVLRRYLIKVSNKGTRDSAESAKYWLDNQYLGTWDEARIRFSAYPWDKDSMADILLDLRHFSDEEGLFREVPTELQEILIAQRISFHTHLSFRKPGDR